MNQGEMRAKLKKELMRISNLNLEQSEKFQLTYTALEVYRVEGNKLRRLEVEAEEKRIQSVLTKAKNEMKVSDSNTKKYFAGIRKMKLRETIKSLAGTEGLQAFIEKFTKENNK